MTIPYWGLEDIFTEDILENVEKFISQGMWREGILCQRSIVKSRRHEIK